MDFSAEQKDELATMLEEKAGETRGTTEASDERIVTALEKMAGTSPQPGEGFAKRVLGAVKNINGGGSGGGKELVSVSIPENATSEQINEALTTLVSTIEALSLEERYKTYIVFEDLSKSHEGIEIIADAEKLAITGVQEYTAVAPNDVEYHSVMSNYSADVPISPTQFAKCNLVLVYGIGGGETFATAEYGRIEYIINPSHYLEKYSSVVYDNDNGGGDPFPACTFTLYSL